jgi:hypothetical protein
MTKHLSTIYFYQDEIDTSDTYEIYRDQNEMIMKKEDNTIMKSSPAILWIDVLKKIGYKESDCVYWQHNSYCYEGWDITDIMKRPIINFPDYFEFFIGDDDNGISYNNDEFK